MKKDRFLVEASFEVLATSKEEAENILSAFLARYVNQRPCPIEISTKEIAKNFNILETTFVLDHNIDTDEEEDKDVLFMKKKGSLDRWQVVYSDNDPFSIHKLYAQGINQLSINNQIYIISDEGVADE